MLAVDMSVCLFLYISVYRSIMYHVYHRNEFIIVLVYHIHHIYKCIIAHHSLPCLPFFYFLFFFERNTFIQQGHSMLIKNGSKDISNATKYFYFK